jgi:RNA polymerase sigma-70 factor (ECF subfamily)
MTGAEAFEAFVRQYQDLVFGTAVRLLGNPAEAEDVAQSVFLKAFQCFGPDGPGPSAAGWLRAATRNACLNHLSRYRARWRLFSEMDAPGGLDVDESYEGQIASSSASAPDEMARAEALDQLERALRRLPHHQRVPLVLFHFEDMSYQDIATVLGVSLGKVKTDIHRAREALRKHLSNRHADR